MLQLALGDPLIKGLTEVANKRPSDPIAYLATFLHHFAQGHGEKKHQERTETNANTTRVEENNTPRSIDVITIESNNDNRDYSISSSSTRDEHGQSMLHFAAARSHGRNALFQLLVESDINIAYRDELYRTARDISIQANIPENTAAIDKYVFHIATTGQTRKMIDLLLDGYDHITNILDMDDANMNDLLSTGTQNETISFLQSILAFEEKRERVHHAIRQGSMVDLTALLSDEKDTGSGKLLAMGKSYYGRCSLHIAVLCQQEEIIDYLANNFTETLFIGDNLERTALHYAMGMEKMETITKVLVKAGAKRMTKDLKGRQPTYYYLNKSDILRLQEEEQRI